MNAPNRRQCIWICSVGMAGATAALGLTVLIGWFIQSDALIRISPSFPAMNPTTAVCFLMAGVALIWPLLSPRRDSVRFLSIGLAIFVTLFGTLRMIDCVFSLGFDVDRIFFRSLLAKLTHLNDRMAPSTAALFVATGIALSCGVAKQRGCPPLTRVIAWTVMLYSICTLMGYATGLQSRFGVTISNPMACHTALGFLLVSLTLMAALRDVVLHPEQRPAAHSSNLWSIFDGHLEQKIATGFISALFLLSLVGIASLVSMQQAMQDRQENERSRRVLQAILLLESATKEVETSKRGYVLTGHETYLQPYENGKRLTLQLCKELAELTADDFDARNGVQRVASLANARLKHADQVIDVYGAKGERAAVAFIESGEGRRLMADLETQLNAMADKTTRLVDERTARAQSSEAATLTIISVGTIAGIAVVVVASFIIRRDLIAKRDAESMLRAREAQFRYLADSMSQIVWNMDRNGTLTYVNSKWCDYVGKTPTSALGSEWKLSVCWKDLPFLLDHIKRAVEEERPIDGEFRLVHWIDDTPRWHLCHGEPQRDDEGAINGWIITWTDIDGHKQIEATLQKAKGAAESASEAKSQFLARMSHEIRTPLNGIIGMLDLLLGLDLKDRERRYSGMAKSSAEALTSLINDILDFSKIEAGKMELSSIDFNPRDLVETVAEMMVPRAAGKNINVGVFIDPAVPTQVRGDRDRVRQILVNLMGNSVKFTETGSVNVEVSVEETDDDHVSLRFVVIDSGIGIAVESRDRLFKTFSQLDVSTTRTYGGTGLGLAICKQLVELMGGEIGAESEAGQGSRFWFLAPFEHAKPADPETLRGSTPDARGLRVLTIEPNQAASAMLKRQLESLKMSVTSAADAEEALPLLLHAGSGDRAYKVALIDRNLPGISSTELARRIKSNTELSDTVLMIMVSFEESPDPNELKSIGFNGHLTKPIRQSQLFDAIMDALSGIPSAAPIALIESTSQSNTTPTHEFNILVVEDNEVNLIVATEFLSRAGFSSGTARNGREAVDAIEAGGYSLVLMDCQMPIMDGFEATRRIREWESRGDVRDGTAPHIPIIALTANAVTGDRERCLQAGMDDYITKPLQPEKLIATIKAAIERFELQIPAAAPAMETPGDPSATAASPESHGQPTAPAIDLAAVQRDWPENPTFQHELLKKFIEKAEEDISVINTCLREADAVEVRRLAHGLKGAAGFVHAEGVRGAAGKLEEIAELRDMRLAETTLANLRREFDRCLEQYSETGK